MFKISLEESLKNFDKNRFITILSVFLFALLFVLEGYTMSYYTINEYRKLSSEHESIQNWGMYKFASRMSSRMVFLADPSLNDNLDIESLEFWDNVDSIEHLEYLSIDEGTVSITLNDSLLNYPNLYDVEIFSGDSIPVYSLFVSPDFHNVESYRIIEGRDFTDEDMIYEQGQSRAVLLGYGFRDIYNVGDIIDLQEQGHFYLGDTTEVSSLKVIGFLAEDSTVVGSEGYPVYDLDTYFIVPMIKLSPEEYYNASEKIQSITMNANYWAALLKTKFLIPVGFENEVLPQLQKALDEYSGFAKFYSIVDKKDYVERVQARTETVMHFSATITVVLSVFAFITIITTIANRISRNIKDYAIHITVGATKNSIVLYVIMEMIFVLIFGLIFGLIILKPLMNYYGMPAVTTASWITFGITFLFVLAMSAVVSKIMIQKHDICTLIK